MNRPLSPIPSRMSSFPGPRVWLFVGLLAWASGCEVEDTVAYVVNADAGSGPLSNDDGGPSDEWALPDCAPDAGTP